MSPCKTCAERCEAFDPTNSSACPSYKAPDAPAASDIDVRRVMLDVVPGPDGEGVEVYATCVADIERKLTSMGQRIEELELAHAAPVVQGEPVTWAQLVRKHISDKSYAERILALPDDATEEEVHACAPSPAPASQPVSEPVKAQPLPADQIVRMIPQFPPTGQKLIEMARSVEKACAEAWGVKLDGIGQGDA